MKGLDMSCRIATGNAGSGDNVVRLREAGYACSVCTGLLDEEGWCSNCSKNMWDEDDAAARRTAPSPSEPAQERGPEG